jgi:hypothetical protein
VRDAFGDRHTPDANRSPHPRHRHRPSNTVPPRHSVAERRRLHPRRLDGPNSHGGHAQVSRTGAGPDIPRNRNRTDGSGNAAVPDSYLAPIPGSAAGAFPRLEMTQEGCDFALANLTYALETHVQDLQSLEAGTATPIWGTESVTSAEQWDEQWITNYDRLLSLFRGVCPPG